MFILPVLIMLLPIVLIALCYYIIEPHKKYVLSLEDIPDTKVGLVLGAGISQEGKPYDELKARLDTAADALNKGAVNTLILSGDNRYEGYDEPSAMKQYLLDNWKIAEERMVRDFAGRSTYESCERAAKIFNVQKLVIFSAGSHLPRAIYLCRSFNIEAYGISSEKEANNSTRRELLARVKALYNTHIRGEPTVLGDPIQLQ